MTVAEWELTDDGVVDASRRTVIAIEKENPTHNAGGLQFGPDDLLYFSVGDGEIERDDPGGEASDVATPMGKILRLDPSPSGDLGYTVPADNPFVDDENVASEIWVYGLRNPWRFSFDAESGDLWIGDVGQWCWEEVNHVAVADAAGSYFGWNYYEGGHLYEGEGDEPATLPVWEGAHSTGDCAVVGGYVYRGSDIPELEGSYVFSDFCRRVLRTITPVTGGYEYLETDFEIPGFLTLAEGHGNEVYVLSTSHGVGRLVPG